VDVSTTAVSASAPTSAPVTCSARPLRRSETPASSAPASTSSYPLARFSSPPSFEAR